MFAEISMFGAGDLESKNPYGLTSAEKVIVKNKKTLNENQKTIKKVDSSISLLSERIDGLESIYDGDSQKLNKLFINFNKALDDVKLLKSNNEIESDKKSARLDKLFEISNNLNSEIETNIRNIRSLKKSFEDIALLVNDINSKYVTKAEFNKLIDLLDKKAKTAKKKVVKSNSFNKPKKDLLKDAKVYFKKDYFTKALPILEYLIKNNYRPAECNFYVGEIKYYRKKYKDALYFFKTSMMLYDKADYLPRLLLHSAISFEKTGQNENANKFYTTLTEVYPESNEAKEASKKIK
ncbi:MAG: hypothetical protein U9Q20_01020 [Campylobacterota bacterium]|nr:hypothetical protein [Campylobacterota bacterium]